MIKAYFSYITALIFVPLIAVGDDCSDKAPALVKYSKTYQCSAASIRTEGEKYPEYTWECYDLFPVKGEMLFYSSGKNKGALPTVNSLLSSKETDFKSRTWMTSTIRCSGKDKVTVLYWGGGNCKGCERAVQYRFSQEGKLEDAKLQ